MMKNYLLPFYFAAFSIASLAQNPNDASALIQLFDDRMASIPAGRFQINSQFKFADGEDTIRHAGVCYFFRGEKNPDSLCHFVVFQKDKPVYAYDGVSFYSIFDNKVRVTDVRAAGGAPRVIRGNVAIDNYIYKNMLFHGRPAFRPSGFDSVSITTIRRNERSLIRLTIRDTTIETALGNVENNKIISTYHWDFDLNDLHFTRLTGEVWLFDGWQFEQKDLSPVEPLPAGARLSDYFDPEKLASEYTFETFDPTAPAKKEKEQIKAGEQLPDFSLPDLNGKIFAAAENNKGLWLLDFWYKGCFPCQMAMPKLENLHQRFEKKGLKVLGINPFDKKPELIQDWLKTRNISYNTLFDLEKKLPAAVGISGYPLLLLVDAKTKKVLYVHSGFSEGLETELEEKIREQLK